MAPKTTRKAEERGSEDTGRSVPIIRTKLHRPPLTDQLVCRKRAARAHGSWPRDTSDRGFGAGRLWQEHPRQPMDRVPRCPVRLVVAGRRRQRPAPSSSSYVLAAIETCLPRCMSRTPQDLLQCTRALPRLRVLGAPLDQRTRRHRHTLRRSCSTTTTGSTRRPRCTTDRPATGAPSAAAPPRDRHASRSPPALADCAPAIRSSRSVSRICVSRRMNPPRC